MGKRMKKPSSSIRGIGVIRGFASSKGNAWTTDDTDGETNEVIVFFYPWHRCYPWFRFMGGGEFE
jgi:hypothetical protein